MKTRNKVLIALLSASVAGATLAVPTFAQTVESAGETAEQAAFRGNDRDGDRRGYGERGGARDGGKYAKRGGHRGDDGPRGHRGGGRGGPRMAEFLIERFDVNQDGTITAAEIEAVNAERVGNYDANGDSALTLEEFTALWTDTNRERIVREFQRLDPDGDATVTLEEYSERFDRMLNRLDRNDDGAIDEDEMPGRRGADRDRGDGPGPDGDPDDDTREG